MPLVRLTMQRGRAGLKGVAVSPGAPEVQGDTISINVDFSKMTKGDVLMAIGDLELKIAGSGWPPTFDADVPPVGYSVLTDLDGSPLRDVDQILLFGRT